MKAYIEVALVAVFLALMYEKPHVLTQFANSVLGKVVLLVFVASVAKLRGLVAGLLAALIVLTLLHSFLEGVDDTLDSVTLVADSNETKKENKILGKGGCKKDADCGSCKSTCKNGTCNTVLEMENKANVTTSTSDIRIQEGMCKRKAHENTISCAKFNNGQTCAKPFNM